MIIDDHKIISLIKQKQESGLTMLFHKYGAAINGILLRTVKDPQIAEELLQQVFLKVWNKIDKYDSQKSSLFTWMRVVAKNIAIDKIRLKSYSRNLKTESIDVHVNNITGDKTNLSSIDVENLLLELDDKYKVVLIKMYLEGYSQGDISKELDIPIGTIKTRIRKAISILREKLKNEKNLLLNIILFVISTFLVC